MKASALAVIIGYSPSIESHLASVRLMFADKLLHDVLELDWMAKFSLFKVNLAR